MFRQLAGDLPTFGIPHVRAWRGVMRPSVRVTFAREHECCSGSYATLHSRDEFRF